MPSGRFRGQGAQGVSGRGMMDYQFFDEPFGDV